MGICKKILIVDDSKFMRAIIKDIAQGIGCEVDEANGVKLCLQQLERERYNLVTMDITMNGMNGIDGVKEIKRRYPGQKVMMVSAMGQKPMVEESVRNGADDFIVKPFTRSRVADAMKKQMPDE